MKEIYVECPHCKKGINVTVGICYGNVYVKKTEAGC
jgi:hypothetical protein